jgi:hypothetical protein
MRRAHRRLSSAPLIAVAFGLALTVTACTTTTTTTAGTSAGETGSQTPYNYRSLPQKSLRGELVVVASPEVRVNGKASRLSAGSRIRNVSNMIVMATTLTNQRLVVNYTQDLTGQVQDVWILSPAERSLAWPRTTEEAQRWQFDSGRQTWTPR